jgi:hypothetical protein
VITASPASTATTLPELLTVATSSLLDSHVTVFVPVMSSSTVAVSVSSASLTIEVAFLLSERALGLL